MGRAVRTRLSGMWSMRAGVHRRAPPAVMETAADARALGKRRRPVRSYLTMRSFRRLHAGSTEQHRVRNALARHAWPLDVHLELHRAVRLEVADGDRLQSCL